MTQRKLQYWVIPPKQNSQFAANMENVLGIYKRPYDARFPVLCMDEQPVQLIEEVNIPIAATKNHARRSDYEYKRAGTVSIFMFCEPLAGWRDVSVRERRTKVDWAHEMRRLLIGLYGAAEKVTLVCDNLNTHVTGAFYEAFEASDARSLLDRLDVQYTPKHGSWLNIAENELRSMTRPESAGSSIRDYQIDSKSGVRQGHGNKLEATRSRLAVHSRGRSYKAQAPLPQS